ncbi:hypothetical protein LPJ73_001277 [Coemansia sp. RSA 2703]|nr:hypothetical protein LPJ73_001277 [Coemansia sp. RSA 2703]KAJ2379011.1 hypothetical protein IW150_000440 [Coemansia sp. RSA 2607]
MSFQKLAPKRKLANTARFIGLVVLASLVLLYTGNLLLYEYTLTSPTWQSYRSLKSDPCISACVDKTSVPKHISLGADADKPYAYIVNAIDGELNVTPGQCVCVRIVVPPELNTFNATSRFIGYEPLPMWPADGLMVDLVQQSSVLEDGTNDPLYKDARVTVSVNNFYPRGSDRDPTKVHVYDGTAQLYDPGVYKIDARLDSRNGQWNAEPGQPTLPYEETQVIAENISIKVLRDPKHPTYLKKHQNLPLCQHGDSAGRWIPEKNLPREWNPWNYVYPAEDGRVWLPYHCRLRRISHAEFTFHMSYMYPSVHWYGDSNSRRTLRPFISSGKWCHKSSDLSRLDCLCNDAPKDLFPDEWYGNMPVPHWYRIHTHGVNGSEIYMDLRQLKGTSPTDRRMIQEKDPSDERYTPDFVPPGYGLRNDYFDLYYLFTRGTKDMYGSYWGRDITSNKIREYPEASLVVFQMITWDVAFGRFDEFVEQTAKLVKRLKQVYPKASFVYRSGPYWCCRAAEGQDKKYSRLRFLAFDRHARQVFQKHLDARVWDVQGPAAQRAPENKRLDDNMPCRSAHSRAEVIHIDNQILMNALINQLP